MGLDAYRFSISWPRIIPEGRISKGVNKKGLMYYHNLIDELLANGIEPYITLFHWDLPLALEKEYGGFLSPQIVFMDPITYGDYPHTMRTLVGNRLPKFTKQQSKMLMGSYDFLGLNYYTTNYATYAPSYRNAVHSSYLTDALVNQTEQRNGIPIGPQAASAWLYVYPRGIRDLLLYVERKYNNPPIYITENGIDEANDDTLSLEEALKDKMRIQYYHDHLSFSQLAIRDGVDLRGYFAWSLFDNFEWSSGYTVRFGINYVDYKDNLKRYPKLSAYWFRRFLQK